ncbi:MAG: YaiO family outer membrane beta-barrel protein [Arenimonas sp.]
MSRSITRRMHPVIVSLAPLALLAGTATALAQSAGETAVAAAPDSSAQSFDQQFAAARALATSGQRNEALRAYDALLERSPGNVDVLLGRGRLYAWMSRWREGEQDLRAVTSAKPDYADAWSALGDLYLWSGQPDLAAEAYGHWLALAPVSDPAPLVARGRAYRAAGNMTAANADFQAAAARGADQEQMLKYQLAPQSRARNPDVVVPVGYRWSASAGAGWTGFSGSRASWTDYTLTLRRHFDKGSLGVEWLGAHRFGNDGHAWALDGYVDLWPRAYANLRYQQGPQGGLFPQHAWRVEVYQGVGRGWELSGSIDRLEFSQSSVDLYGLGVGRYVGNWYLRGRVIFVDGEGSSSTGERLQARYYYAGDGDNYVEFTAGFGQSSRDTSGLSNGTSGSSSSSASVSFVKFLSPRWGFKIGAGYGDEGNGFTGHSLFGTVYARW